MPFVRGYLSNGNPSSQWGSTTFPTTKKTHSNPRKVGISSSEEEDISTAAKRLTPPPEVKD